MAPYPAADTTPAATGGGRRRWWLFSPAWDVGVFLGSALLSIFALGIGARLGFLETRTPEWTWITAVLFVDVAHVWSTGFRVYFDPVEVRRRPGLYLATPVGSWLVGCALYFGGPWLFWRALAYLAVWHFIRQQYGWVALYRTRCQDPQGWVRWLDTATIYIATIYPLLYWHAHLPRRFWWFLANDFTALPGWIAQAVAPFYWLLLVLYGLRSLYCWTIGGGANPGKDMVVVTTVLCWYVGIVWLNSDYAFTVTNVLIHGIPYIALIYFARAGMRSEPHLHPPPPPSRGDPGPAPLARPRRFNIWPYLLSLWALAYVEEMFWDRAVWHERSWLFGSEWEVSDWHVWIVPLLAVPQMTHYVLDGFIWKKKRRGFNP